jgi:DNA invertase Pin-like site-specific DNA recombinase
MGKLLIGYVRVSTKQRRKSGLGLEAQLAALAEYARQTNSVILETYKETGKHS